MQISHVPCATSKKSRASCTLARGKQERMQTTQLGMCSCISVQRNRNPCIARIAALQEAMQQWRLHLGKRKAGSVAWLTSLVVFQELT